MTISTEVPLVDDVVYSVSDIVDCNFHNCQNKESAFVFSADFFDLRLINDNIKSTKLKLTKDEKKILEKLKALHPSLKIKNDGKKRNKSIKLNTLNKSL